MKNFFALFLTILFIFTLVSCDNAIDTTKDSYNTKERTEKIKWNTVTFETNGGTNVEDITGKTLYSAPITSKNGFLFRGWYLDQQLTTAAVFPLDIKDNMTLYAKWLKIKDTSVCSNTSLKMWKGHNSSVYYYITPNGFDLETLAEIGYKMTITVSYDVYYEKDYRVIGSIGYMGSPEYEVSITNDSNIGQYKYKLSTTQSAKTKTISYSSDVIDIKNEKIKLKFSTDNIQNIIYIENIKITYECHSNSVG